MAAVEEIGGRGEAAGRNLTFGMLDALGRAIVTGAYEIGASRPRRSSRPSTM